MPPKSRPQANSARDAVYNRKKENKMKAPKKRKPKNKNNNGRRRAVKPRRQTKSNVYW